MPPTAENAVAREIVETWNSLDGERSTLKTLVQEIMERYLPRKATITTKRVEGDDTERLLTDSTGERCLQRFAAGMRSYVCPPGGRMWRLLTLRPGAEEMYSDLARPLAGLNDTLRAATAESNFDEAANEMFQDFGTAGTATIEPRRGTESALEYQCHPFEQVVFEEDNRGRVDSVYRRFSLTVRQAVQEFGAEKLPQALRDDNRSERSADRRKVYEFVHAVTPRLEYGPGRLDVRNMPFASRWTTVKDPQLVRDSGMPQQRYLVCRFSRGSGEKHGRSPAMTALPDVRMLNRMEEDIIDGVEGAVRPLILAPHAASLKAARIGNARLLYYRPNALNPSVKPEPFNAGGMPQLGEQYAEARRTIIAQAMYNDLFQIMDQHENETATGVRALMSEKLNLLAPNYGRLKSEWFDPQTRIDLSILGGLRAGAGGVLSFATVRYISTLALAVEYAALGALRDGWQFLSWIAEVEPSVWDRYSFDDIADEITQNLGWPMRWMRPQSAVEQIRASRLQYQRAQQAQQLALAQQAEALKQTQAPQAGSAAARVMGEAA